MCEHHKHTETVKETPVHQISKQEQLKSEYESRLSSILWEASTLDKLLPFKQTSKIIALNEEFKKKWYKF
jgi:hypothetical protein